MIENIEQYYTQIADYMLAELPEDDWTEALYEATFFPGSSTYEAEFFSRSEQKPRSLKPDNSVNRLFREMRKLFQAAGKPLWGKAVFHLKPDGTFQMNWNYDNCDAAGNALHDTEKEIQRIAARQKRLTR